MITKISTLHTFVAARYVLIAVALTCLAGCGSDDGDAPAAVAPTATGTFTDPRDGHTYGWVQYGQLQWMTDNFAYDIESTHESTIYQPYGDNSGTSTDYLDKYGRLYNYEGALKACPDGWRLPTDDDWQQLEQSLGMSQSDAQSRDWRGRVATSMLSMYDTTTPLNLLLGGFYDSYLKMGVDKWRMMGVLAFYWTATQDTTKASLGQYYFYRKLAYNKREVYRESMEADGNMLSVRYVRNANNQTNE